MNEEKVKNVLLGLFIVLIIGGLIWATFSLTYSPIQNLRSNTISESKSYKDVTGESNNNNSTNTSDKTENINKIVVNITTPKEEEIASFSTTIYDKEEARIHNIKLAVSKLDGATVNAGEEFSFNNTVGPMGEKQGYQKATGFNGNGKKVKIYGGGMCQISSTLYNAALIANFEITERHPHSRRVYYVAKDKDATVSYGGADLKFKNNSDSKIKITATTDGHEVTIKLYKI